MIGDALDLIRSGRNEFLEFIDIASNAYPANALLKDLNLRNVLRINVVSALYNDNNCAVYAIIDYDKAQIMRKVLALNIKPNEKLLLLILLYWDAMFYIGSSKFALKRLGEHLTNDQLASKPKGYKFYFGASVYHNCSYLAANLLERELIGIGWYFNLTNKIHYSATAPNIALFVFAQMALDLVWNLDRPYEKITDAKTAQK